MTTEQHGNTAGGPFTRRQFLVAGSALAASPWLIRLGGAEAPVGSLARLAGGEGGKLSVGYVQGSGGKASLREVMAAGGAHVVSAMNMSSGDRALHAQTTRIRIDGLSPGMEGGSHATIRDIALDAVIPSPDRSAPEPLPYFAWTLRSGDVPRMSNSARFVAASGREPGLGFLVRTTHDTVPLGGTATREARSSSVVFTTGRESTMAKLQPGIYLLGLEKGSWDRSRALPHPDDPAWSRLVSMVVSVEPAA